ncbi:MAG: 16S rRNA (cytidine(1402)-2'-O)-methyltransferase [Bifidobacteriaceae bacterium]|nr:16S rRNA (cytidine(1402)-2'-O)-methyltransferase [Bifidobacteriaceae bacterium]
MKDMPKKGSEEGELVLLASPIGNDLDLSPRARKELEEADLIAAEDTRRFWDLCRREKIRPKGRVVSYFDKVEKEKAGKIVEEVLEGRRAVLISDAGTPVINDPGYVVVNEAIERGARVTACPGPCAAICALILSGFRADRFCYEGFIARKEGERREEFKRLKDEERTAIFYESARRLQESLKEMEEELGPERRICIARELTKDHEEVVRTTLGEAAKLKGMIGEIAVVVEGRPKTNGDAGDFVEEAEERARKGERLKDAVKEIAKREAVSSHELYRLVLEKREK